MTPINPQIIENKELKLETEKNSFNFSDIWKTAKKVAFFAVAFFGDLLILPFAGILTLHGLIFGTNMDPKDDEVKKNQTPILLIHGNGFNESQWIIGRQFLKGEEFGSVFSLNLDGLISNKSENGIEEYAKKVSEKIEKIKKLTGRNDIILIGHSMGGFVGATYSEDMANEHNTNVTKMISISTPFRSPPLLAKLTSITGKAFPNLFKKPKRFKEMRNEDNFLTELGTKISNQQEKYYFIYSKSDIMVPGTRGKVDRQQDHIRQYSLHDHYTPMICPSVWHQVQNWILA